MAPSRLTTTVAVLLAAGLTCAACSSGSSTASHAPTTASASTPVSISPTTSASVVPTSATPTASPSPTSSTTLGGACDTVLPVTAVDAAVGTPVAGKAVFIINQPDSAAGQVERINCQYGVAPVKKGSKTTAAKVEVSVSLYASDAEAAARVSSTLEQWRQNGATPHAVSVGGHPATVLTGYQSPLLVVGSGPRTVAVTMVATLVAGAKLDSVMAGIAAAALSGSGG